MEITNICECGAEDNSLVTVSCIKARALRHISRETPGVFMGRKYSAIHRAEWLLLLLDSVSNKEMRSFLILWEGLAFKNDVGLALKNDVIHVKGDVSIEESVKFLHSCIKPVTGLTA